MEHSPKYNQVLDFYKRNLWNEKMVRNAVIKDWITKDEFKEITNIPYEES